MERISTYNPLHGATEFLVQFDSTPVEGGTLYWNMEHGIQMLHRPSNTRGFGGHVFRINGKNIKGPWSSRAEVVREFGNPNYVGHRDGEKLIANRFIIFYCNRNHFVKLYDLKTQTKCEYRRYNDKTGKQIHGSSTLEDIKSSTWWPTERYKDVSLALDINKINNLEELTWHKKETK